MGISIRPDPVADYLAAKGQQAADPVAEYLSARKATKPAKRSLPTDANNQATPDELAAAGHDDEQPGIAGSIADATQGIPGMGLVQAGVRSVVRQQPYREAYSDITRQTDKVPTSAKFIGRAASSSPLAFLLPGSAAASGAAIGGATEALDANPDRGLLGRLGMGTVGALGGAAVGKVAEMVPAAARAVAPKWLGGVGNPSAAILEKQAQRAASAKNLYAQAMAEGQGTSGTHAVQSFLAEPDIYEIVGELANTRDLQHVAPDSPEMLDAVYKVLSDRAGTLKKGLESVTPNRPNIGRFRLNDTRAAQQEALSAMDTPMPSYRTAVTDYATRTGDMNAFMRGNDAVKASLSGNIPSGKALLRSTPEALGEWAARGSPSELDNAAEGAIGATRNALAKKPFTAGRHAVGDLPSLLRELRDPTQARLDLLTKLGLLGTNAALPR